MKDDKQLLLEEAAILLQQGRIADFGSAIINLYDNEITCGCFLNGQDNGLWGSMLNVISVFDDDPNNFNLNFSKGFVYLKNKRYELAYSHLSAAVQLSPLTNTAWSLRSAVPSKYNPSALEDAIEALVLHPSARNYYVLAGLTRDSGQSRNGEDYLVRVVTPDADNAFNAARHKAVALYDKCIEINPKIACAYYMKAISFNGESAVNQRVDCYLKCLQIEPNHWAWEALWRNLEDTNNPDFYRQAANIIEQYLDKCSDDSNLFLELCIAYRCLGEYEKALQAHKHYSSSNSSDWRSEQEYSCALNGLFTSLKEQAMIEFHSGNYLAAKNGFEKYVEARKLHKFVKYEDDGSRISAHERESQLISLVKCYNQQTDFSNHNAIYQELSLLKKNYHEKKPYGKTTSEDEENVIKLNLYEYSFKISFGVHAGKKISDIVKEDSNYILWCIINLKHFCVSNFILALNDFEKNTQYFEALETNIIKNRLFEIWNPQSDEEEIFYSSYDDHDYDRDNFDALTGGQLGDWEDFSGDMDDARDWMGLN